jgi:hypothetical protein
MGYENETEKAASAELKEERVDDAVLALLYLNLYHCGVVWKGFDWDAMNRLLAHGRRAARSP